LKTYKDLNYEWFIIDNNSQDMDFNDIIIKYSKNKRIKFIKNKKNESGLAYNKIINKIKGRYVLFLGPDTLQKGKTIEELIKFMDNNPQAGMASGNQLKFDETPLIYYHTKWTFTKFVFLSTRLGRIIDYFFLSEKMGKFFTNSFFQFDENRLIEVDQIPGACMIIRTEFILEDGYIVDPDFPFYFNDVDICKRVWDRGYKIYIVSNARIIHDHLSSFNQKIRGWKVKEFQKGQIKFFRKHYKNLVWIIKILYILNSIILNIEYKIKKNRFKYKAYLSNIRNYLNW